MKLEVPLFYQDVFFTHDLLFVIKLEVSLSHQALFVHIILGPVGVDAESSSNTNRDGFLYMGEWHVEHTVSWT